MKPSVNVSVSDTLNVSPQSTGEGIRSSRKALVVSKAVGIGDPAKIAPFSLPS